MNLRYLLLLLLTLFHGSLSNTEILSSEIYWGNGVSILVEKLGTFPYLFSAEITGVTGNITLVENGCHGDEFGEVDGFIVILFEHNATCSGDKMIEMALERGALAVGLVEQIPGENYARVTRVQEGSIVVFSVSEEDAERWRAALGNNTSVVIVLEVINNPVQMIFESPWFWVMQIGMLSLFTLYSIFIGYKLFYSVKNGLSLILPISLTLELLANIMRIVYWMDPINSRTIIPDNISSVLFSLSYAPSFIGQLLISLYWLDSLRVSTVQVKALLSPVSMIIFAVAGAILFFLSIMIIVPVTVIFRYLFNMTFVLAVFLLMVFYLYIVIKLGCFSREMLKVQKHKKKRVYRTLVWYSLSAFFCLAFLIEGTAMAFVKTPMGLTMFYFLTMIILFGMSFCKVFPVSTEPIKSSRSTKGSKSQQTKSETKTKPGSVEEESSS